MRRGLLWLLLLLLGLAAEAGAGAAPPEPASVIFFSESKLPAYQGGAPYQVRSLEAWDLVRPQEGAYLAVSLGPQGQPVQGRWLARRAERGWPVLWLFAPQGLPGPWWVAPEAVLGGEAPSVGGRGRVGLRALAMVPAGATVLAPGPASGHRARLARLRQANLPPGLKRRLAAGRLEKGDNFWWAELAWGKPQRSFMVNYVNDEQHYVYLRPGGAVLLRFVSGRLQEAPPSAAPGGGQVANPPTHR